MHAVGTALRGGLSLPRSSGGARLRETARWLGSGKTATLLRIAQVNALVLDVGWVNGLAAIRSLGRAGITSSPWITGRARSDSARDTHSRCACPTRPRTRTASSRRWRRPGPASLFPTHDPPLNALARNRDRLDGFLFPFPPWDRLEAIQDKRHQLEAAVAAGVDIPETVYPPVPPSWRTCRCRSSSSRSIPTASSARSASRPFAARREPSSSARTPTQSRSGRWCRSSFPAATTSSTASAVTCARTASRSGSSRDAS